MNAPSGSKDKATKANASSPSLGVSKSIKKTRSKDTDTKHIADALKEDIEKKITPKKDTKESVEAKKDYSAEYNVKHPTDDPMRNKVRTLLVKALCTDDPDAKGAQVVASAIENAMYKKLSSGVPYKNKARTLSFNLKDKKNKNLRESVLHRELPPSELIQMSSEDLANDELKKDREKIVEKFTRDAQPFNNPTASTDQFKCGKCKERKVSVYTLLIDHIGPVI